MSIDALENTNNVRYLRKQYIDPLTGKADWRIIHVGENKTTVKGFFGQPLGGLNTTGAGGSLGSASTLGTGFGGTPSSTSGPTSPTGTTPGSTTPSTTVSGGTALSAGFSGATIGGSTSGSTTGTSTSDSSSGSGGVGQVMGVGSAKTGTSILNPNQQTTYETWEFIYDPKIELLYQQANLLGGGAGGSVNSVSPSTLGSSPGQSNTPRIKRSRADGAAIDHSTVKTGFALVLDGVHDPAREDDRAHEQHEAIGSEADHHPRLRALRDAEDHRREEREQKHRAEVTEHHYEAFRPLASECASTAAM